ncbi:hypothetical protein [Streptomyces sp. 769]|uniref:hypothetical protein n=1 Tax=Streptomyces sp. 769 TaxID=1262452 RepID=UPI000582016D|nr:hypothetical protein [Streptomyces sp. 769]AJC61482.1 hypothetical protein GZL_08959 [Streptomyces sp. 769]
MDTAFMGLTSLRSLTAAQTVPAGVGRPNPIKAKRLDPARLSSLSSQLVQLVKSMIRRGRSPSESFASSADPAG